MSKAKKFALLDTNIPHLQILAEDSELGQRIAAALERRIAQEFMTGHDGPTKGKKSKKGGAK